MIEVGVLEAKTRLSSLLDAVERGEGPFVITRYGKRIAVLSREEPYVDKKLSGEELVAKLKAFRETQLPCPELDGLSWEELRAEAWRS
ncbi:type II toxin-antitoxin system Phd/YefM family antitoxin [Maricaulis sp.]|uniref:type II toxin-antitoxin system Phd/YefM family antitoxin n=1 Tax=Maricaulis sp. TaxID=1486257 RepID=UPI003A926A32